MIIETGVGVIGLDERDIIMLGRVSKQFSLDYDDAYQYTVAEKFGLHILSFDSDFDRTEKGRRIPG
jgi:predicted nucleic acid-binding protein